jgi:hypothetical protein
MNRTPPPSNAPQRGESQAAAPRRPAQQCSGGKAVRRQLWRWPAPPAQPVPMRRLVWWYGLMGLAGFAFGLYAPRRPFGDDVLAHPLVVFAAAIGVALLALRMVTRRPVPDILPDRVLLVGIAAGVTAFLAGNFAAVFLARM